MTASQRYSAATLCNLRDLTSMNRRTFAALISGLFAALSLAATPALAKPKPPVTPPPVQLNPVVDPDPSHDPDNVLVLDLSNGGRVLIRLMPAWAPGHVERIKTLTKQGFYNGVIFHRVIEGFMAQTGDPTGTGTGGSQLPDLKAEFNRMPHVRGTVSMARTDAPDSANSQFFIVFYPRFALDNRYNQFRSGDFRHGCGRHDRARRTAGQPDQGRPGLAAVREQAQARLCRACTSGAADAWQFTVGRCGCGIRASQAGSAQAQGQAQALRRRLSKRMRSGSALPCALTCLILSFPLNG